MTGGLAPGSRLIVLGVNAEGSEVTRLALGHGDDPLTLLELHGWQVRSVRDVVRHPVEKHVLTVTFVVEPLLGGGRPVASQSRGVQPDGTSGWPPMRW